MEATTSISQIISLTQGIVSMNLAYLGICVTIILFAGGLFYLLNLKPLQESIEKQENKLISMGKEIDTKIDNFNNKVNDLVLNQTKELKTLIDQTKNEIDLFKIDTDAKISKVFQEAQKELKKLKEQYQTSELENL